MKMGKELRTTMRSGCGPELGIEYEQWDDVVVVGPGPMGIMGVQYAKVCGARRVFLIGLESDER